MKIAVISDTHGRPFTIPECDVFIHAGDITAGGTVGETLQFANWLRKKGKFTWGIIVPGNHDKCFQTEPKLTRSLFDMRVFILVDEKLTLYEKDGTNKTFYGSPGTPPFYNWWFMDEEDRLAEIYKAMPDNLDVLITHGPPRGILDPGHDGSHVGSTALLEAVGVRKPQRHIFGHLHSAGGHGTFIDPTWFCNIAAVDESYTMQRGCLEFEI